MAAPEVEARIAQIAHADARDHDHHQATAQPAATLLFFPIFSAASRMRGATWVMNSSWLRIARQRPLPP
jgi:hypothetical protein